MKPADLSNAAKVEIRDSCSRRPRAAFLCHLDLHLYRFRLPLMRALMERGWEVLAISPQGAFSDRFAAEGLTHVSFKAERGGLNPIKEGAVVARLAAMLRELRPDLIHSFTIKPNIYGPLAASWVRVGKRVAAVTGLGSFYTGRPSLRIRVFRAGLDRLYAAAMRRVDRVLFENTEDRDELVRLGICRLEQCVVVPGVGIDKRRFHPAEDRSARDNGPVVVTMTARLIRDKGVDEFLSAAVKLKERWGDSVVFQLAGEEDPGNPWPADTARISELADKGVVCRLGFVQDVAALLHGTDMFVLPSYREGMPVSVLEAMSAGLPIVTTDAVGCRDTIIPEESGLLVPVRDAVALADAIDRLIRDASLRRRLGRAAAVRAAEKFAVDKVVAALLEIYHELLPDCF